MVPATLVIGVGAVADPVPPVAAVYQSKDPVPLADKGLAVAPRQYLTGLFTVGAGMASMLTVLEKVAIHPSASVT